MPTKEFNDQHCLLSSDRKHWEGGLKMTVIVLPDPVLWFGASQVECLFLLTESQWKVTSYAPDKVWSSERYLSCQRKRSESLGPAAGGSAGQCASFNYNASAFLAVRFWDFSSASALIVHSQLSLKGYQTNSTWTEASLQFDYKLQFCKDMVGLQQMKTVANEGYFCTHMYLKTNARPNMHKASGFIPATYGSFVTLSRSHPHSSISQGQGQSAKCGGNYRF